MAGVRRKRQGAGAKSAGGLGAIVGRVALVACALAVCAVPAVFVDDVIGYLPLISLVSLIALSFAYLQVLVASLSFSEESLAASCERGSTIDFALRFVNASPLVLLRLEPHLYVSDLFGEADEVTPVALALMPREDREFRFQAAFDHIGTYSAGVERIVVYDLLGLFFRTVRNDERHLVRVLPKLFDVHDIALSSEISSDSLKPRQTLTVDDMDYAGVREYVWGDPIKTIHWKLSSRNPGGEYFTRLFESYSNPGLAIVIDTSAPGYSRDDLMYVFDGIVESALSLNRLALAQGIDSVLEFSNRSGEDEKMRLSGLDGLAELLEDLPRIAPADGQAALELLRRELNTLHGQDNVALCTSQVSERAVELLVTLKLRKRNPMMLFVVPPSLGSDEVKALTRPLRRLDQAQVPCLVFSSAAGLAGEGGKRL